MKFAILCLTLGALFAVPCVNAGSKKPTVTVRFHAEVNPNDGESFAMPVKLENLRRPAHLSRVPVLSERQIRAIYPFDANDGTWGCYFIFDQQGRIRLETMSSEQLHTALVLIIGTKLGQHQVIDMLIDRPVSSGTITVPRGLTPAEVVVMKQQFPVLGEEKDKKGKKPKEEEPEKKGGPKEDWMLKRSPQDRHGNTYPVPRNAPTPAEAPRPAPKPGAPREQLRELDLPRLAD